ILGTTGRAHAKRPLALMPAYTFVATASAAEQCGFMPVLDDIGEDWMLQPERVLAHPDLDRIGLVVPVAPYGRPVPQAAWAAFRERTGIPVVIDGAAAFDTLCASPATTLGPVPVALSFHATKSLGTGEGGCVICTDGEALDRIGRALNFGFHAVRDCRSPNTNGKMSEYHAAVGLAELDGWDEKLAGFRAVAQAYRQELVAAGLDGRIVATPTIGANYVLYVAPDAAAAQRACERLEADGIDFRFWYGLGLHRQTYYADLASQPLTRTDSLAVRVLGLPTAPDLDAATVARVCAALVAAA
ncbi:MAG: DegT/DnrJ/EryC1/StrS family aminotransferase, partial [Arenimonas sp.]